MLNKSYEGSLTPIIALRVQDVRLEAGREGGYCTPSRGRRSCGLGMCQLEGDKADLSVTS